MKRKTRPYVMTARAATAEATRARIRASAVELYGRGAIEDFTLDEVARRAETTVQTVLRAFGSKDELIYAVLEELAAGGQFVKPAQAGDVGAAVAVFFDIYESIGDFVMARLNEERRWPALKPYSVHIHIKDAILATGQVVAAGLGDGSIEPILLDLKKSGYRGFLSLEPHLAAEGQFSGFSGPSLFKVAADALKTMCRKNGIPLAGI